MNGQYGIYFAYIYNDVQSAKVFFRLKILTLRPIKATGLFFIVFQPLFLLGASTTKPFPGLVLIESTYKDESQKKILRDVQVKVRGAGIILRSTYLSKVETYFIISVSHLTQGQNLKMRLMSDPTIELIPKSNNHRLADNDNDLEIIEIEKPNLDPIITFQDDVCDSCENYDFFSQFEINIQSNQKDIHYLNSSRTNLLWLNENLFIPIPWFSSGKKSRLLPTPQGPVQNLHWSDLYPIPEDGTANM